MKEKFIKVVTNKWFQGAISCILTFLILLQEILISNPITVWIGLAFSAVFGLFAEFVRFIASGKFNILNVIPWLIGGLIACIIALFI